MMTISIIAVFWDKDIIEKYSPPPKKKEKRAQILMRLLVKYCSLPDLS